MDAYDFSKPTKDKKGTSYHFGVDNSNIADTLRELAGKLDSGEIAVQSCKILSTAQRDDFSYTVLRLNFSEKRESKKNILEKLSEIAPIFGASALQKPTDDFIENIEYARQFVEDHPKLKKLYGEAVFPVDIVRQF